MPAKQTSRKPLSAEAAQRRKEQDQARRDCRARNGGFWKPKVVNGKVQCFVDAGLLEEKYPDADFDADALSASGQRAYKSAKARWDELERDRIQREEACKVAGMFLRPGTVRGKPVCVIDQKAYTEAKKAGQIPAADEVQYAAIRAELKKLRAANPAPNQARYRCGAPLKTRSACLKHAERCHLVWGVREAEQRPACFIYKDGNLVGLARAAGAKPEPID